MRVVILSRPPNRTRRERNGRLRGKRRGDALPHSNNELRQGLSVSLDLCQCYMSTFANASPTPRSTSHCSITFMSPRFPLCPLLSPTISVISCISLKTLVVILGSLYRSLTFL